MSDGYDFFGTSVPSHAATPLRTWPPAASVGTTAGPPAAGPPAASVGTAPGPPAPPPRRLSRKALLTLVAVVVVAAVATSVVFMANRSHPIRLPASAAGLPAVTHLPSAQRHDIKEMEKQLAKAHVRDIHTALYLDGASNSGLARGLVIVGGHTGGSSQTLQQASTQLATALAGSSTGLSQAEVAAGGTTFQCLWAGASGHVVSACYWWSSTAMLMGFGIDMDAEQTADALGGVRTYAGLR